MTPRRATSLSPAPAIGPSPDRPPTGLEEPDSVAARAGGPFAFSAADAEPFVLSRLPSGRHSLPREFVEENQRNRLMAGAIASLAERGYPATTAGHIIAAAGVSNSTFYRHYPDKEACVLATYAATVAWLECEVAAALSRSDPWPDRIHQATVAGLALLDSDQRLARLCVIEILATGLRGQAANRRTVDRLALYLAGGRAERAFAADLPPHLEVTLVGGALSLIARSLGDGAPLTSLAPELTEYLLAPYLGVESARRVAGAALHAPI
jgi:AcrR family transcriptional regulator